MTNNNNDAHTRGLNIAIRMINIARSDILQATRANGTEEMRVHHLNHALIILETLATALADDKSQV